MSILVCAFAFNFLFLLTSRELGGDIFSCSPDTPLNNLIHLTSLPALTKKNATKLMATAASVSNYIQSKNEHCVVITSIALTICSTHLYHLCALANTYLPLGIYASLCSMVLYSVLSFFWLFPNYSLVLSKNFGNKNSEQQFYGK